MNIKQLQNFIRIAENKNFTQTAKEMYLSQPTLTQQIRLLEEEIGFPLFYRTNKVVELTEAGAFFYDEAKEIIIKCNDAVSKGRKIANTKSNAISIGYFKPLSQSIVPAIIKEFSSSYKDHQVELVLSTSNQIYKSLLNRNIDFIFIDKKLINNNLKSISFVHLFSTNIGFIVSKDDRLAKKGIVTIEDIAKRNVIIPNKYEVVNTYDEFESDCLAALPGYEFNYVSDYDTGISSIRSFNNTICIAPNLNPTHNHDLVFVPFEKTYLIKYGIAYLNTVETPTVKKLISASQKVLAKYNLTK